MIRVSERTQSSNYCRARERSRDRIHTVYLYKAVLTTVANFLRLEELGAKKRIHNFCSVKVLDSYLEKRPRSVYEIADLRKDEAKRIYKYNSEWGILEGPTLEGHYEDVGEEAEYGVFKIKDVETKRKTYLVPKRRNWYGKVVYKEVARDKAHAILQERIREEREEKEKGGWKGFNTLVKVVSIGLAFFSSLTKGHASPSCPTLLGSQDFNNAWDLALSPSGTTAYVADADIGLLIFNVSNPANLRYLGSYGELDGASSVLEDSGDDTMICVGDRNGVAKIDVSDKTNPKPLYGYWNASFSLRRMTTDLWFVHTVGFGFTQLAILNTRIGRSPPICVGSYDKIASLAAWDIALSSTSPATVAYLAAGKSGLQIINVYNPAEPTYLGSHQTPSQAVSIAASNERVYVGQGSYGALLIFDVVNPSYPRLLGTVNYSDASGGIALSSSGTILFAINDFQIQIVDVENATSTTLLGEYRLPGNGMATGIAVSGTKVFVTKTDKLLIFDVSGCSSPSSSSTSSSIAASSSTPASSYEQHGYTSLYFTIGGSVVCIVATATTVLCLRKRKQKGSDVEPSGQKSPLLPST